MQAELLGLRSSVDELTDEITHLKGRGIEADAAARQTRVRIRPVTSSKELLAVWTCLHCGAEHSSVVASTLGARGVPGPGIWG